MLTYSIALSEYGFNVLKISYPGQQDLEFDINDFYKDQTHINTLYLQINEYITTLPEHIQKELYNTYSKVYNHEYTQNYSDINYVVKLENNIAKASELLNYENFKIWMRRLEGNMIIPENILEEYITDPDMNTTKEKTYVRHEYRDLISLITFIRALSPLYVNYYNYIKQITPHYYYKLFMLFIRADIYTCYEIEKLKEYIHVNQITLIGTGRNEQLIIASGLSDDDVLDSLVSEVIFNKLLTIDFFNKKCNIISFIFQTVKHKGSFVSSDNITIRSKTSMSDPSKEDMSYFEDYRKTSDIPIGTVAEIQHALSNINSLVNTLGFTNFDYDLYYKELENTKIFMNSNISKIQIYLLGWFLNKIINPRSLYHIEIKKLVELMLFAKIVLLQNNQKFIGLLLSSTKAQEGNYVNIIIRNSLNKSLIKKLTTNYTFFIDDEKQSIIEKTITEVSREIVNNIWIPIGIKDEEKSFVNSEGYLIIPNNINDLVCDYVDFVNQTHTKGLSK